MNTVSDTKPSAASLSTSSDVKTTNIVNFKDDVNRNNDDINNNS